MSTRSAARKAEPWSFFLYSDAERFQVKTIQFANGPTGEGFLLTESLTNNSFCSFTGGREVEQKLHTSTM